MDIQVIDVDTITRKVSLVLKPKKLTGISKLIQIVVLSLLNDPGRDVLDPDKGAGFPGMIGQTNIDPSDSTELYAEIQQRVTKAETEIINDQIGLDDPPEEKLRELKIMGIEEGDDINEFFVRLRLINEAGRTADILV